MCKYLFETLLSILLIYEVFLKKKKKGKARSNQASRSNHLFIVTENTGEQRTYQITPQVTTTKWTLFHQQTTMEEKKDGRKTKRLKET